MLVELIYFPQGLLCPCHPPWQELKLEGVVVVHHQLSRRGNAKNPPPRVEQRADVVIVVLQLTVGGMLPPLGLL